MYKIDFLTVSAKICLVQPSFLFKSWPGPGTIIFGFPTIMGPEVLIGIFPNDRLQNIGDILGIDLNIPNGILGILKR